MSDGRENLTLQKGVLRICCADPRNLILQPSDPARPGVTVRVCRCGRRHIEMAVDPGTLGVRGAAL